MTRLIPIDADTFVAGQIAPADLPEIVAAGVSTIVNNRPDGEEAGQPAGAEIEAAARAAGLDYRHIPFSGVLSSEQVEELAGLLDSAPGKLLAFCRTGTRSTYLWSLAQASRGADAETLIAQAAAAGYDIAHLRPHLKST
jgi:uncharacterized protein (TIGR01244 family)